MNIPQDLRELTERPNPARVRPEVWRGCPIWIKKAVPPKATIFHNFQRFFSPLIPVAAFRPTVSSGGAAGLRHEAARISVLQAAGFRVPEVLAISADWIVLSDIGVTVDRFLNSQESLTPHLVRETVQACARELARLHLAGLCHGRAKLNDFIYAPDGRIGFIDFEEDVSALPPGAVQSREIWLMLAGVSRYSLLAPDVMASTFAAYREVRGSADFSELRRMLQALKLFRMCVYPCRWLLSDDVNRAYKATDFLLNTSL